MKVCEEKTVPEIENERGSERESVERGGQEEEEEEGREGCEL